MNPKLIILNGPLGIGKSTIAQKYADDHPLTLFLDIDKVWSNISHWRETNDISSPLAHKLAAAMALVHLSEGYDVVIPQIYRRKDQFDNLDDIVRKSQAKLYEFVLIDSKKNAINRYITRGKGQGFSDGFRPEGIITNSGREDKLASMYDEMEEIIKTRPNTITINSLENDIDSTYQELISKL